MLEAHRTFLVCILDLMQPISTALSAGSKPSGVETLFIVNRTTFWIAFPSEKKNQQLIIIKILGGNFFRIPSRIKVSQQNFEHNKRFLRALPAGRLSHFTSRIQSLLTTATTFSRQNDVGSRACTTQYRENVVLAVVLVTKVILNKVSNPKDRKRYSGYQRLTVCQLMCRPQPSPRTQKKSSGTYVLAYASFRFHRGIFIK